MSLCSQAPTRVDLAGGTLDIWPLYLFHKNSQTINFAIDCYARCCLSLRRDKAIKFISHDLNECETFSSFEALRQATRFRLPLLARLALAFEPARGFTLETHSESPAGAGLGGSSALNIAVCGALSRFSGRNLPAPKLIEMARNVEAQVLGVPTGEQDYYSAMYGGVQAICLRPDGVQGVKLHLEAHRLSARVVLCYTGQSRSSGINNWEVMKAHIDGKPAVIRQFDRIAAIAAEMRRSIEKEDWRFTARLLDEEWKSRKKNYPGITTAAIERLMSVARRNGGLAAKVCGAGGGGCVMFFVEPEARERIEHVLSHEGAQVMPFEIAQKGLLVRSVERERSRLGF